MPTTKTAGRPPGPLTGIVRNRPSSYLGTLVAACSAVFAAQSAGTLPASINGLLQSDLHAQGHEITWIPSSFMIAVVVFELTFGVLGDLFGRRKLVAAGCVGLLAGSVVSATAPSIHVLWIGSALNGLGAGAILPGSLALAAAVSHTAASRAKAVAIWAGFLSAGSGAAPLIGGLCAHYGSWRDAFWVLAALAVIALLLTVTVSAESSAPEGRRLDVPGQITFAIGLILVLFAAVQGSVDGWGSGRVVGSFALGVGLLIAFVLIERRVPSPILHLGLFKNRAFAVTSIVAVVGVFGFVGMAYGISMWMGPVQHQDPLRIAAVFIVMQAPAFVLIPVMSRLIHYVSPAWLLSSGFAMIAVGAFWYAGLDITDDALTPFWLPTLLVGIGFALILNSVTAAAINAVPLHLAGMASATINMVRDLGFALGPVVVGAVALSRADTGFMTGLRSEGLPVEELAAAASLGRSVGPLAVNSLPPGAPGAAAHHLALVSLGGGFAAAFVVCGVAALVAAACSILLVGVRAGEPAAAALTDPQHPQLDEEPRFDLPLRHDGPAAETRQ